MDKISFNVPSISCSMCSKKIKEGVQPVEGVQNVDVDLKQQIVNIEYDTELTSPNELADTITQLGYEVLE